MPSSPLFLPPSADGNFREFVAPVRSLNLSRSIYPTEKESFLSAPKVIVLSFPPAPWARTSVIPGRHRRCCFGGGNGNVSRPIPSGRESDPHNEVEGVNDLFGEGTLFCSCAYVYYSTIIALD